MLAECMEIDVRVMVLGHLQRGGQPTPRDRWLATQFGHAAAQLVSEKKWGYMVALQGMNVSAVPMADAIHQLKTVDPQGEMIRMARDLGIVFG